MKRVEYPDAIRTLIAELKRMPGIGPRSAERIAMWMVQAKDARSRDIATAIVSVCEQVHACAQCGFFTTEPLCAFCSGTDRDESVLCVVEQPTDILPLERTGVFRGRYHALGGRIAPLDHIGPDDLRIESLVARVQDAHFNEVILALGTDVEGDATANYIAELLHAYPVTISRIAQGLPAGGGLEHADELTLNRALAGRTRHGRPS